MEAEEAGTAVGSRVATEARSAHPFFVLKQHAGFQVAEDDCAASLFGGDSAAAPVLGRHHEVV